MLSDGRNSRPATAAVGQCALICYDIINDEWLHPLDMCTIGRRSYPVTDVVSKSSATTESMSLDISIPLGDHEH